ncbi:diguanylate cyclase [Enterobacter sp. R1(2018)]|uniref:diguanylate cyclase n=1 Tax=Enterobacter sp. R1(2018) TaxID=2447891 RepID=UPI000EB0AFCC|nr:diguanylate cyclase [Enterobacter sp. R1(2018)]RKQ40765.1 diguanylate cyclase [Enterobacter sp. R1(2018)]
MTKKNIDKQGRKPHGLLLLGLGLLSFVFTFYSLKLTLAGTIFAPVWFPTSVMTAAFFRNPSRLWPLIAVICSTGSLAATAVLHSLNDINLVYTAINIVEALMSATLMRRFLSVQNPLQNLNSWVRLALCSAVVPPVVGGLLAVWLAGPESGSAARTFFVWVLSEAIGALALLPAGLLIKPHYFLRHREPKLLLETVATFVSTLVLSYLALRFMPWPFTFIIIFLMWSAIRLPRLEAFFIFLVTLMVISLMMATNSISMIMPSPMVRDNAQWLPFLLILLPANVMTMVMYAFREERKHITESEARFRNAMEYSAIGMALVSIEGHWIQVNKSLSNFLGYTAEQLRALTFQQITYPEDLHADLHHLEMLLAGDINSYSMEKRYYTSQGEVVWALLAVSVVRNTDRSPLYLIAQIEDINDLKHTEWVNKRLMERITLANEAGGIGIWEWDLTSDVISWDKRMFDLYELPPHVKPTYKLWAECILTEDLPQTEKIVRESLRARMPFKLEYRIKVKDGIRHIRSLANRVLNKNGDVERLLGINMDMTEVKQLNEALYQEKERLHITLDSIGEAVICTDVDMNVTFMNPVAEKLSGWPQDDAIGQHILAILRITFGDGGPALENIHSGDFSRMAIEQDVVLYCRNGGSYDIHYSITPLTTLDGQSIGSVLVIQDVTESRKMLKQLSYSASHDSLTHLANRVSFENELKRLLQSAGENRQRHALVFIDLDRFKAVNDTAGHAAGDALLRELSSLMLSMLRTGDFLARLGGDEFGLLLPDCSIDNARYISERIINSINDYHFVWEGQLYRIGASAGITQINADNKVASEVVSQADIACYTSKNSGRGRVTAFEAQQHYLQKNRSVLDTDEKRRIINENPMLMLALAVAPPRVPESASFYLLSLKFWNSEGEVVEEHTFRSGLVESELQQALDRRVFSEFFREFAAQIAQKGFGIALALSPAGLASSSFVDELLAMLDGSPLPARLLHLQIKGESLLADDEEVYKNLQRLRDRGCQLILTHTGRELDIFEKISRQIFSYIIIDNELIQNVHSNLMDEMMVTIIHGHAQRLALQTLAGPADLPMVMDTLSGIGINLIYGETISAPQPLSTLLHTSYFAIN